MTRFHFPTRQCAIIPFPNRPVRSWLVHPCPGGWMGRTIGIPEPDDAITAVGSLALVFDALQTSRQVRRGLPIVVCDVPWTGDEVAA